MTKKPAGRGRRRRGAGRPRSRAATSGPVPLHKRTTSHFDPADRKRGQDLFDQGRVRLEIEGQRARGTVEGTERPTYGVGVDWSGVAQGRVLRAFCECQRFAEGRPCKHLWATLLALGEAGPEHQAPGKDRLKLRKERPEGWRELGARAVEIQRPARGPAVATARPAPVRQGRGRGRVDSSAGPSWRSRIETVRLEIDRISRRQEARSPYQAGELRFLVNAAEGLGDGSLVVDLFEQRANGDGSGRLKRATLGPEDVATLLRPAGAGDPRANGQWVGVVAGSPAEPPRQGRNRGGQSKASTVQRLHLPPHLIAPVLARLAGEGRLGWWDGRSPAQSAAVAWDGGEPWRLALRLETAAGGTTRLNGALERGEETVALAAVTAILPPAERAGANGPAETLVVLGGTLARLEALPERDVPWLALLREAGEVAIPQEDLGEALTTLLELPTLPRLETPEGLPVSEEESTLQPRLVLKPDPAPEWMNPPLLAELSFVYGDVEVSASDARAAVIDIEGGHLVRRDLDGEHRALVRLLELGLKPVQSSQGHGLELPPRDLPLVAEPLLAEGWAVEVHGRSLRAPSPPAFRIESGIDWFELSGGADFPGGHVEMKELLSAISRGDRFVKLDDGSEGLLPAAWMETYDSLAKLAHDSTDTSLRFLPSQALLVDALLAANPPAVDRDFAQMRDKLRSFDRIKPKKELASFQGTLREYQRDGLGWLHFLREFGLGGVLADDMGLGKTVQVLALLQANRTPAKTTGLPSLVVAPRSLVYNWIDEAKRFTPKLKAVEYHGAEREGLQGKLGDYDLVVTTYGTLRRDIAYLATVEFDTVILDEAQAIKNPESQTARASRLLVAQHRLALTGTPIENHLGDLGAIFEYLNPGLLGRLPRLDALAGGRPPTQQEIALVAEGMRPFILRRTKAQVLADLPPKTEQVLVTTLHPKQRELYDKVRAGYQASLLEQVEKKGVGGSTIQVLEALLRLRQIACHPGLVRDEWEEAGSGKLDTLFEQVAEVLEEGHKVLVFSQFTSLLAYVRRRLDEQGTEYAYLDGSTRDRGAVVERFQEDPDCNLFLISLKAGGVGLNLTAAGYVFLLDPWWNPAVEAQAIDRAHRIGQTQPVIAYRMIAGDTVEEKILALQRSKRELAEAILEPNGAPLRDLTADDLKMLLS